MSFHIPSALRDISQLLSANVITKVVGIATLMLYARILTKEQMAAIPICQMLAGVAVLPFSFGIYPTLVKRLPQLFRERPDMARSMVYSGALVTISGAALATVIVLLLRHEIAGIVLDDRHKHWLILLASLGFVPTAVSTISHQVLWAKGRFGNIASLDLVIAVIRPLVATPLFFVFGLAGLVVGLGLAAIAHALIAVFCLREVIVGGVPRLYPLKRLLRESFPFYLESYVMYFRREGDNWFVTAILGPGSLAVYYIAKQVYNTFFLLRGSVDMVVVERFARLREHRRQLSSLVQTTHDTISHVVVPCILMFISLLPSVIWILGGIGYEDAVLPAAILLIAVLISFMRLPVDRAIFVGLPASYRFWIVLLESILLLIALATLGPLHGIVGMSAARVLGQLGGGLFGLYTLSTMMSIRLSFNSTARSLIISSAVTALILCLQLPLDTPVQGVGYAVAYALVWIVVFIPMTYMMNPIAMSHLSHLCRKDPG